MLWMSVDVAVSFEPVPVCILLTAIVFSQMFLLNGAVMEYAWAKRISTEAT